MSVTRYACRGGWRRNRRWVEVHDRGLTVQPWLGRPLTLYWCDLLQLRWVRSDQLSIGYPGGELLLGAETEELAALATQLEAALAGVATGADGLTVSAADIERWLAGYRSVTLELCRDVTWEELANDERSAFVPLIAVLIVLLMEAGMLGALPLVAFPLVAWRGIRVRDRVNTCTVQANAGGVSVRHRPSPPRRFGWSQIRAVVDHDREAVVMLDDGGTIGIPRERAFAPVIRAVRAVAERRADARIEGLTVSDAAISPVRDRLADEERGLSRTDAT